MFTRCADSCEFAATSVPAGWRQLPMTVDTHLLDDPDDDMQDLFTDQFWYRVEHPEEFPTWELAAPTFYCGAPSFQMLE